MNETHPNLPVSSETQNNENDDDNGNECKDSNQVEAAIIVTDIQVEEYDQVVNNVEVDKQNVEATDRKSDIDDDSAGNYGTEKITSESTSPVESDHVEAECISDPEERYKKNIMNKKRNQKFIKIVHDTRAGESKIYGHTDDLIISVDEHKFKYSVWAIHDSDKESAEVYSLLKKWPSADPKRCKYGVDTLHKMLPDIVKNQQQ